SDGGPGAAAAAGAGAAAAGSLRVPALGGGAAAAGNFPVVAFALVLAFAAGLEVAPLLALASSEVLAALFALVPPAGVGVAAPLATPRLVRVPAAGVPAAGLPGLPGAPAGAAAAGPRSA